MVKVQLINRQSGSLLAEWIITIGLILLLISIALPIVTTPSRYTLMVLRKRWRICSRKFNCGLC